jgi:hypothetical protein
MYKFRHFPTVFFGGGDSGGYFWHVLKVNILIEKYFIYTLGACNFDVRYNVLAPTVLLDMVPLENFVKLTFHGIFKR